MAIAQELQIESNLTRLPDVVSWFEQFNQAQLPSPRREQAKLALIEGFTNAVRHAQHPQARSNLLFLKAALNHESFWFEIWDQGAPYDFEGALTEIGQTLNSPDFNPLEREKQWGNVIFLRLIEKFNWMICYSRHNESQNCLHAEVELSRKKQAEPHF